MPIGEIAKAVADGIKETAKEVAKEGAKIVKDLDRPLNAKEIGETVSKERNSKSRLEKLDQPLNAGDNSQKENLFTGDTGKTDAGRTLEFDKNGFRELTDSEKAELKQKTKWGDKVDKCKINEDGVIKFPCRNEDLAGKIHEVTGVEYEKKIVEVYGYKVEVVVPKFDSPFEVKLPDELQEASDKEQFKECNKQLNDALKENPDLAGKFTEEQLEQIEEGTTKGGSPDGFTWHHDAETGKMQLVDSDLHGDTGHTGGKVIWGGGNDYR